MFRYHGLVIALISYVAFLFGALLTYPVFGQYQLSSYCEIPQMSPAVNDSFSEIQPSLDFLHQILWFSASNRIFDHYRNCQLCQSRTYFPNFLISDFPKFKPLIVCQNVMK